MTFGAASFATWLDPRRTALLIVDVQVDFASPEGVMGRAGVDLSAVPAALDAAERLAIGARAAGIPVVFTQLVTRPETDSAAWNERFRRRGLDPVDAAALCRAGDPGCDFVGPGPAPGDLVIAKTRYSGFFGTDLADQLRRRGVDTLVICGLTTECCVDSTVRDAFQQDFHVFLAPDACAAYEPDLHAGALKALDLNCAILAHSPAILPAWTGAPRPH